MPNFYTNKAQNTKLRSQCQLGISFVFTASCYELRTIGFLDHFGWKPTLGIKKKSRETKITLLSQFHKSYYISFFQSLLNCDMLKTKGFHLFWTFSDFQTNFYLTLLTPQKREKSWFRTFPQFLLVYCTLGPWRRDSVFACVSKVRCVCESFFLTFILRVATNH